MKDKLLALPKARLVEVYNGLIKPKTPATSKTFSKREVCVSRLLIWAGSSPENMQALTAAIDRGAETAKPMTPAETIRASCVPTLSPRTTEFQRIEGMLTAARDPDCPEGERALLVHDAVVAIEKGAFMVSYFRFPEGYDSSGHRRELAPRVVRVSEKPIEPPPPPPTVAPFSARVIRVVAEGLLLENVGVGQDSKPVGHPYTAILAKIKEEFPKANTSVACLRWYATRMRERGEMLPARPREQKQAA